MKYSNEIVSKVIAGYLGKQIINTNQDSIDFNRKGILFTVGLDAVDVLYSSQIYTSWKHSEFKLLLRPLSYISEEHWQELIKIGLPVVAGDLPAFIHWLLKEDNFKKLSWQAYQYLKDKGYSMPEYLLDGLDPISAGIAIEKI